jgi:hypothetical protein
VGAMTFGGGNGNTRGDIGERHRRYRFERKWAHLREESAKNKNRRQSRNCKVRVRFNRDQEGSDR